MNNKHYSPASILDIPVNRQNLKQARVAELSALPNAGSPSLGIVSGAMFEDMDGNKFLDWVGGVGVLNIGYSHPEVIEAVKKQTEKSLSHPAHTV